MPINVQNHQRRVRFDLAWLRRLATVALAQCFRQQPERGRPVLRELETVEVPVVSDEAIAAVHEQFMGIPGPTDVITFDHGEIVISAWTAQRNAARFGKSVEEELALYTIHGLLHLNGFEDNTDPSAARMRAVQRRILKACLAEISPP
ncbi:MAG: rRNA maturation RNase YbeY [Akkermansiaceae bacterium]|nr:rRNA maturation RNase YbeY [Verrucomicrobiales bacterium]